MAEPGHTLVSADYSQVELRMLAHIAGEDVLKDIFRRGEDVHTATAEAILGGKTDPGTRSKAKMVNYGIVYGLSAFGLADRLQIEREEAQEFIDRYLERFPAVAVFIQETIAKATTDGHVTTLFGRIRRVPELRSRNRQTRQLGERLAVNMVIQGTAADIIKVAMVRARDRLRGEGLATRLVLQIHDELLFEAPDARGGARLRDRARGDGGGVRDGPTARGGRGKRPELARGEVVDKSGLAVMATAFAGGLIAMQAPINATLGRTIGSLPAASVSFAIGLVALVGITLIAGGGFGRLGEAGGLSWYYLTGGLLGAVYVTTALIAVRTLGAGGVTAATIGGQLTLSVILDRLGVFGLEERGLSLPRVLGVALLALGTVLIVRN